MVHPILRQRSSQVVILVLALSPLQVYFAQRIWSDKPVGPGDQVPASEVRRDDGSAWTIEQERDRMVVLSFWASWCGPCRLELPHLDSLYRELDSVSAVSFYAVNAGEPEATARSFLVGEGYALPLLLDTDGSLSEKLGVSSLPTLMIIDREGKILSRQEGYQPWLVSAITGMIERRVPGAFGGEVEPEATETDDVGAGGTGEKTGSS